MSIQVWIGDDIDKSKIESALNYDSRLVRYAEDADLSEVLEQLTNTGLFAEEKLIVLHGFLNDKEASAWFFKQIEAFLYGSNNLILYEEKLLAPIKKKLAKHEIIITECFKPKSTLGQGIQTFAITDAIINRDRKNAWVVYTQLIEAGKSPEEIMGLIWWQVKTMWMVVDLDQKAGLKPFVYQKTKRALQKYSKEEIKALAKKVVDTYHEARLGGMILEHGCERLLLAL